MLKKSFIISFIFALSLCTFAFAEMVYKVKVEHKGGDLTPQGAHTMLKADQDHTFIIDVRTRVEYQDIGHPAGAYNIPLKFYTTKVGKKGYEKTQNNNFAKDLKVRFNPETDSLLFICRSGKRSCMAATIAVEAGFKAEKVFNVMGGVEGDKIKDENNPLHGQRMLNGWKNEKLPWTYSMKKELMYQPDVI